MLNQAVILLFIISFLDLALGLFVFLKNPKERVNASFALFSLAVLIWINASFFQDEMRNFEYMYFLLKVDFASAIFTSFFLLLFCLDVSRIEVANNIYVRRLLIAIPILFSVLICSTRLVVSGYEILQGVINPILGSAHLIYDALIGISISLGIGVIVWKYRKSSEVDKSKFVYLFIGFSISSMIAFVTNILLTDYIKNTPYYNLYSRFGSFSAIFMIMFSGYAIVKHRLLNLKIITTELLSLGILVFSLFQVLKSQSVTALITNGIIFVIILIFVIMLVRSVENEVKRKDELQLLSDRLAIANEKLRDLDQARAEFMSMASHQLQTPLTAIRGFSSLLLEKSDGDLTAGQEGMVKRISVSSERMVQLVEDYLNLSRIESGKMEFKFAKCRLEDICQEVVDTLALKAKGNNLSLIFNRPDCFLPAVMIDGPKVREVISNLVDNAIKYTPEGSVTINLGLRKNESGNKTDFVRITVTDTGMGMASSDIPKLFAKFSRVKDEQHLKVKGTGLGLYVGKVMIEANGGKIWAESDGAGKGSRFILELPVEQAEEEIKSNWGGSG